MKQKYKFNWRKTTFVMGARIDHVPIPETQQVFTRQCAECQTQTVTETEYPSDVALICNVCAPAIIEQLTQEHAAQLAVQLSAEAEAKLRAQAQRLHVPYEQLVNGFLAWQTGKLLNAGVYNPHGKKK
jgi:recombinational DNA repair protein (RecF pathway)